MKGEHRLEEVHVPASRKTRFCICYRTSRSSSTSRRLELVIGQALVPPNSTVTSKEGFRPCVNIYVASIVTVSAVAIGLSILFLNDANWRDVFFFSVAYGLAHFPAREFPLKGPYPLRYSKGRAPSLSVGFLVLMTVAFVSSPLTGAIVGLLSPLTPGAWRGWKRSMFNSAQTALYTLVASVVFHSSASISLSSFGTIVWAGIAAGTATLINTALVAGVVSLDRRQKCWRVFTELLWPCRQAPIFAYGALMVGLLYREIGPFALMFLIIPLAILRYVRSTRRELTAAYQDVLTAFITTVELKDPYTMHHSTRVSEIATLIHRELGHSEKEIERRFYGALLHDIGKVVIPTEILAKTGPLNSEDRQIIAQHPGVGAAALGRIGFFQDIIEEVFSHHERLDGGGYPRGLTSEEISSAAKILAVADTYEALTSNRPYRLALTAEAALEEMRRACGSQLEEDFVSILGDLVSRGHIPSYAPALPVNAPLLYARTVNE